MPEIPRHGVAVAFSKLRQKREIYLKILFEKEEKERYFSWWSHIIHKEQNQKL